MEQILDGGTVGLIAFLVTAITALIAALGLILRAFLTRAIITRATYDERVGALQARIVEVRDERNEALAGWKEQTETTDRLAQAVEQLTAALHARNELDSQFHQPRTRR